MKNFLRIITIFATIMMVFSLTGCSNPSDSEDGISANSRDNNGKYDYYKRLLNNNSSCRYVNYIGFDEYDSWTFERQIDGGVTATYSTPDTDYIIPNGFRGRVYINEFFDPSVTSYDIFEFTIEGLNDFFLPSLRAPCSYIDDEPYSSQPARIVTQGIGPYYRE